jgi:hypothetical protein
MESVRIDNKKCKGTAWARRDNYHYANTDIAYHASGTANPSYQTEVQCKKLCLKTPNCCGVM